MIEMLKSGILGNPQDPMVQAKVLRNLDMSGLENVKEDSRMDANEAELEQQKLTAGVPPNPAQFFHNHPVHLDRHTMFMKSPAYEQLQPQQRDAFLTHVITHMDWVNPMLAMGLRQQYQLDVPIATPPPPPLPPGSGPLGPQGPQPSAQPQSGNAPPPPQGARPATPPTAPGPQRVQ
jgi:hypothetical protein